MNGGLAVFSDRGVIEVSGPEARSFLQRLITNDVEHLASGQARYAALLSPQGKIAADFFVVAAPLEGEPVFYLDTVETLVADLVKKLTLYRLRAKVEIRDRSNELGVVAMAGDEPPAEPVALYDDPRAPGLWRRAILPKATLDHAGDDAGRWAYRVQRINAGVPEGGIDFAYGETFPHEANLDRLHGVDFKKGCYVGQEVVSRMQHRGTARTRILAAAYPDAAPAPGTEITAGGKVLGTTGSAAGNRGLATIRLDRLGDALASGETPLAGDRPVTLTRPACATFPMPDVAASAAG